MTYNVFGGTLNPAQFSAQLAYSEPQTFLPHCSIDLSLFITF